MLSTEIDYESRAGGDDGVVGEGDGLACEDIRGGEAGQTRGDLVVIAPGYLAILVGVVDIDEDGLFHWRIEN